MPSGREGSKLWIAFTFRQYHPPPFCWGQQFSVPNFKKGGSEKNECLQRFKESARGWGAEGASYVSCQKKTWLLGLNFKFDLGL